MIFNVMVIEVCEVKIEKIKKSYYAILPAAVRHDSELCANAKLIYAEISALCNKLGYCYASNRYFSELFEVSISSVSRWIQMLQQKEYIQLEYQKNGIHYNARKIYLNTTLCSAFDYIQHINQPIDPTHSCTDTLRTNTKNNTNYINNPNEGFQGIYGELKNVYLSDDEYRNLIRRCGYEVTTLLINDLSIHIGSTGKKYKSHYYTVLSWYRQRIKKNINHPSSWYLHPDEEKKEEV